MSQREILRPGHLAPKTGPYKTVSPQGRPTGPVVHVPKDKPMPPTPRPKQGYVPR